LSRERLDDSPADCGRIEAVLKRPYRSLRAHALRREVLLAGVTRTDIEQLAERIDEARQPVRSGVAYRGSLLLTADDLLLCLFEGPSRAGVQRTAERGGIPWERLMDAV
jgi:Protein of unknown function (DUF4242)